MVAVLTASLNEDEFDLEIEEPTESSLSNSSPCLDERSRKDLFLLSSLEAKIDKNDANQQERFSHIKNQVIEKIKTTKIRRSMSSTSSKRRISFLGTEGETTRSRSRPRTVSPPPDQ